MPDPIWSSFIITWLIPTVASVGPYPLIMSTFGNLSLSFLATSTGNTSPIYSIFLNLGNISWLKSLSTKHIPTKDGVETQTSMSDFLIWSNKTLKSATTSLDKEYRVAPFARPGYNWDTLKSNE